MFSLCIQELDHFKVSSLRDKLHVYSTSNDPLVSLSPDLLVSILLTLLTLCHPSPLSSLIRSFPVSLSSLLPSLLFPSRMLSNAFRSVCRLRNAAVSNTSYASLASLGQLEATPPYHLSAVEQLLLKPVVSCDSYSPFSIQLGSPLYSLGSPNENASDWSLDDEKSFDSKYGIYELDSLLCEDFCDEEELEETVQAHRRVKEERVVKIIDDLTNASFHTFIDDLIATVKEEIEREQALEKAVALERVAKAKADAATVAATAAAPLTKKERIEELDGSANNRKRICSEMENVPVLRKRKRIFTLEEMALRKRNQNRRAAQRYREKLVKVRGEQLEECTELEEKNDRLREKIVDIENEIERFKQLLLSKAKEAKATIHFKKSSNFIQATKNKQSFLTFNINYFSLFIAANFKFLNFNIMTSFWPVVCRIFVGTEGVLGALLNVIVIALIWRKRLSKNVTTYRVGVTVTAFQGALQNTLAALSCQVHLFHYDQYAIVMYGPVAWAPKYVSDILLFLFVMAAFGIWELIPSSCMLQYLALSKPHYSYVRRLFTAYGVCIALIVYSIPFFTSFHSSPELCQNLTATVETVHELDVNDTVRVYGGMLFPAGENDRSVLVLAGLGVFPTYSVGYFIFFYCCRQSYQILNALGGIRSERTMQMQRKFFIMIILQAFLPLVILSMPLGLFGVAIITGMAMDLNTLALSFSLWLVPIVQGCVSLTFVVQMKSMSSNGEMTSTAGFRTRTMSISKTFPDRRNKIGHFFFRLDESMSNTLVHLNSTILAFAPRVFYAIHVLEAFVCTSALILTPFAAIAIMRAESEFLLNTAVIIRYELIGYYCLVMFGIAFELLVALEFSEWYESGRSSTIIVFIFAELLATIPALIVAFLIRFFFIISIFGSIGFTLYLLYEFLPEDYSEIRFISIALFDVWISIQAFSTIYLLVSSEELLFREFIKIKLISIIRKQLKLEAQIIVRQHIHEQALQELRSARALSLLNFISSSCYDD
uniref:G protein-coupled receptor n=1 Tax=Pristionchus pacificus TaxID=54126 RepID=A0A2A6C2Y1_PRIPA